MLVGEPYIAPDLATWKKALLAVAVDAAGANLQQGGYILNGIKILHNILSSESVLSYLCVAIEVKEK
ncbi:hypothetical protein AGMMS49991_09990 [Spirochaetia bacterium]|nr:hypothetical protein AGMMS49991_09990 [Spirochaetia bacterium]